jgi:hypothetical protein
MALSMTDIIFFQDATLAISSAGVVCVVLRKDWLHWSEFHEKWITIPKKRILSYSFDVRSARKATSPHELKQIHLKIKHLPAGPLRLLGVVKEAQLFVGNYWYEASEETIKEDEFLVWGKASLEKRRSIEQALNRLLSS